MATTFSRMIKKAAASSLVIPLPNRTTSPHRKCTSAIFSALLKTTTTISRFSTSNSTRKVFQRTSNRHHPFSTLSENRSSTDDYLLCIIESEIDKKSRKVVAPRDFPFKIVDNPEDTFIRLTREYHGEEIEVEACLPYKSFHDVDLSVTVSTKDRPTMKFIVEVDRTNDITINSLYFENPNDSYGEPGFSDLDKKVQNDFYIYLEDRGIEPSISSFLYEYLRQKKRDNYIGLLKNLKDFLVY